MKITITRRRAFGFAASLLASTALVGLAPAYAATPKDTVVMAKQIDDII